VILAEPGENAARKGAFVSRWAASIDQVGGGLPTRAMLE
jgi:hypothetical protein